jgi:hypothetical protein
MTTNLSMGGNKILNVNRATAPDSVPTLGQVQSLIDDGSWVPTATSDLNMNYKNITTAQSYGLQPSQPSNPPLILSNQGTGDNLLLAMAKEGGDGMAFVYDTVYNKPPTASFVSTATSDLNMGAHNISNLSEIDMVGAGNSTIALSIDPVSKFIRYTTGQWLLNGQPNYGLIYDSKFNQPPSGGGGGGNFLTNPADAPLQMQGEAITGINWLNFTNQQGSTGLNLDLQCRVINNKSMMTIQNGPPENGVGMIYDSLYNPPPGAIPGLAVDAETNLLTYNEQPIMINQYLTPTNTFNFTSTITQSTQLSGSANILASCVVSGSFEDLFSPDFIYSFSVNFNTAEVPSTFPFTSLYPTDVWINITDANGQNIVALDPGQPTFYIRNTFLSFTSGVLYFQAKLSKDVAPVGSSQYFLFTNSLNTNAVGPYTITIAMQSIYDAYGSPAFATVNKFNPSTFQIWDTDKSNPFPVVSNYDLTNGITSIRTAQNGLLIKSYRSGGTTFYTDSIQLVPTRSTTPKMYYGCQSGTYSNDPPINFALDIFPIPLTQFTFQWWIFCWGDSNNYITYTASGIADPNANQIYGESGNLGRYAGTIISPTEGAFSCSVSVGGLAITAMPIASSWNWTLTYDITSL